ncbi:bifunctional pyr operon transcriptional regulator/uracil phosphoribosyltransferase PyrR [Rhodoflexus caldus]|uniref:bifunctional pyr operon transcriptional regulator/uracil phosphoribosyltransferase PyrR n=1 Tax=Rhodoflexus caldus TaxID=2891236 RepID=UPI002029FAAB|nr:bifunctional pyr operon transcriptional regulator/uracil phosphoribosyltransferase PyrR [Rhodoflexus caldus]
MEKLRLLDGQLLDLTMQRLCHQLVEKHEDFAHSVLVGMQPRGRYFADRIKARLDRITSGNVPIGYLDITFYRDDFRRRNEPLQASETLLPFDVEGKHVVLIDDVLFTGRTIRAALSALGEYGRPASVELLVLIDRLYSRDLPIQPDYTGRTVNSILSQRVVVEWTEQGAAEDAIWLVTK